MHCTEFLDGFSDFVDGRTTDHEASRFEHHLTTCDDCRRYHEVWERGVLILRAFGPPEVDEDFEPRLETRIHHLRNEMAIARTTGSGASTVTVLSIAAALLLVAWTPFLVIDREVEVELAPITAQRPAVRSLGLRLPAVSIRPASASAPVFRERDLWEGSTALLLEHSPLLRRQMALGRPGLR